MRTFFIDILRENEGAGGVPTEAPAGSEAPAGGAPESGAIPNEIMGGDDLDAIELPEELPEPAAPDKPAEAKPDEGKQKEAAKPKEGDPAKPAEPKPAEAKPTPTEERPATPTPPSADILAQLDANKKDIITHLAGERFALTQEESDQLDVNPTQAIPSIMARVFYESQVATINQINSMVPRIVASVQDSMSTAREAEQGFYSQNKDLNAQTHGQLVGAYAKAFRSANPTASKEDAYRFVANAVRSQLGLPAPLAEAPARPKGPAPFTPARGGAKVVSQTPVEEPFAGMGTNFDDE